MKLLSDQLPSLKKRHCSAFQHRTLVRFSSLSHEMALPKTQNSFWIVHLVEYLSNVTIVFNISFQNYCFILLNVKRWFLSMARKQSLFPVCQCRLRPQCWSIISTLGIHLSLENVDSNSKGSSEKKILTNQRI